MMMLKLLLILALASISTLASATPRIAIIIDDLGYHRVRSEAIVDLPGQVTCAIIPKTPYATHIAKRAARQQKEVILHIPMEPPMARPLDEGGLHSRMNQQELQDAVRHAITDIPQARGANNHMGGLLTTLEEPMQWLMEVLAENRLFFIDSRTSEQSQALLMARQEGVRYQTRDIFLDNERSLASINQQFNKGLAIARKRGHAIMIGHPYPETIEYLTGILPLLKDAGVELVPVSQLLRTPPAKPRSHHVTGNPAANPSQPSL